MFLLLDIHVFCIDIYNINIIYKNNFITSKLLNRTNKNKLSLLKRNLPYEIHEK